MTRTPATIAATTALALWSAIAMNSHAQTPRVHADLAVIDARIWTNDRDNPHAQALAVLDGRVIAVGDDEIIRATIGEHTRVIDAHGARILPGLIDAHVHLNNAGATLGWIALRDATGKQDMLRMIRDAASDLDDDAWVLGRGWSAEGWEDPEPPTADELDSAAGGRPTILVRMDGHQLLASRSAMRRAGVDEHTPAPPGGKFGRLPDGRLSGEIYEEAQDLIWRAAPSTDSLDARKRNLRIAARECVRLGVTQIGAIESPETARAMAALDQDGELPIRIGVSIFIGDDTIADWRPILEWALTHRDLSDRVKVLGFKGFMDGSLGSRTAWMTKPYNDNPPDEDQRNAGMPLAMAGDGTLRELILLGAGMGLQPAVHAIGDRANHELLDWFAEIPAPLRARVRPRVEHAQHVLDDDVRRYAQLGVIPSMQPLHKADDGRYAEQRLGAQRLRSSYAYRDFTDQNANLAFGSDWPVVSVNPFLGIHAAVSALTMNGDTFLPENAITVEEALRAYTSGAAHALFTETHTGALKPGYDADFIILDRDILNIPIDQIPETTVTTTIVGGDIVHQRD
ncbi:MAG: amidohydrolase [Phycisphaeraceae bacterium]|nr:amidohydrolase [Phycisphaeraceae bacterium]